MSDADAVAKRTETIWRRQVLARLLILAVGTGLFGILMYQIRAPQRLNFGSQDSFFLQGFQTSAEDVVSRFRWTNGDGRINLWDLGLAAPVQVSVRVSSMRAQGSVPVRLYVNGRQIAEFENKDWETYTFPVPPDVPLRPDRFSIWLQSDVFSPADQDPTSNDTRELGVVVAWVEMQPLWMCGAGGCDFAALFTVPVAAAVLQLVLFAVSAFVLCIALGLPLGRTQWVVVALVVLVGLGIGFARILAVQYLSALAVWAAALAAAAALSRFAYDERRKQGRPFGLAETLALTIFFFIVFVHVNRLVGAFGDPGEDGQVYFTGAKNIWAGVPLYDIASMKGNLFAPLYKIPPFYALLQYPYRSFGVVNFLFGFRLVNEALYLVTLFLLTRIYRIALVSAAGFGLFTIGLMMDPVIDTLREAQSGLLILFSMTLSLAFLDRDRDGWGGIFLALPSMIKLYPAFLLLPLLLLRRWRAVFFFVAGVVAVFAAGVLVVGWEQNWIYLTQVLPLTQGSTAWPENSSLFGFLSRFFTDDWGVNDFSTPGLRVTYYFGAAATTLGSVWVFLRYLGGNERFTMAKWRQWVRNVMTTTVIARTTGVKMGYALFTLTLLMVSPLTWNHYLPTVILAVPAILVYLSRRSPPLVMLFLSAVGITLIAYGIYPIPIETLDFGAWKELFVSYRFYGIVALWVVVLYALWTYTPGSVNERDSNAEHRVAENINA